MSTPEQREAALHIADQICYADQTQWSAWIKTGVDLFKLRELMTDRFAALLAEREAAATEKAQAAACRVVEDEQGKLAMCQRLYAAQGLVVADLQAARKALVEAFRSAMEILLTADGIRRCSHCGATNQTCDESGWGIAAEVDHTVRCPLRAALSEVR